MNWKVRHQGSPRQIDGLTLDQVAEGLQDGLWEPTDEVMGPEDLEWSPIENHPLLADAALDVETVRHIEPPDETRLDFNALIDVTLVLLIFCILTTSYQTLEKVLEMPKTKADDAGAVRVVGQERVDNFMILVTARKEAGQPVIRVENTEVPDGQLQKVLTRLARETKKSEVLLDAAGVDYGTVIKIIDAAGGARIDQVHFLARAG